MALNLIAELDAMVEEAAAAAAAKKKGKGKSNPAGKAPPQAAAEHSAVPAPVPYNPVPHRAIRRIHIVRTQHCRICGSKHPIVSGEFIEFAFPGGLDTHRAVPAPESDRTFEGLPREVEWLEDEAVTCPTCLAAEIILEEITDAILGAGRHPIQLPLFPWSECHAPTA